MKIAKYKLYGSDLISECHEFMDSDSDYIRLTEPVDVEFVDLPPDDVIPPQIDALDKRIADVRQEMSERIKDLEDQKANLLALTHEPDEDPF